MSDHDTPEVGSGLTVPTYAEGIAAAAGMAALYDTGEQAAAALRVMAEKVAEIAAETLAARDAEHADRLAAVEAEQHDPNAASHNASRCHVCIAERTEPQQTVANLLADKRLITDLVTKNRARAESAEAERDTALREVAERDARLAKVERLIDVTGSASTRGHVAVPVLRAALANPDGGGQ